MNKMQPVYPTQSWIFSQVKVPLRPGGAAGTGWAPAVLQNGAHWICPAAVLQCIPLQAVLCHPWIITAGEKKAIKMQFVQMLDHKTDI